MQGVVGFWRDSRADHVGCLTCQASRARSARPSPLPAWVSAPTPTPSGSGVLKGVDQKIGG